MYGERQLKEYRKFEGPRPEPRILHQTFSPYEDSAQCTKFDVRSSGMNAHMSTTMFLERKYTVQLQLPSIVEERYVLDSMADHTRKYRPITNTLDLAFLRKPGFLLQNNAKNIYFDCNAGTVQCDPRFLQAYTKLYEKELKQFIRASGRSFANHTDNTHRGFSLGGIKRNNEWSNSYEYIYVNKERNNRRIPQHKFVGIADDSNNAQIYYKDAFWAAADTMMNQDFTMSINDSTLFPTGPFVEGDVDNEETLYGDVSLISDTFQDFYDAHWSDDDRTLRTAFVENVDKVWNNGHIDETSWGHEANWTAIKNQYKQVFQTYEQALAFVTQMGLVAAGATEADKQAAVHASGYRDQLGWGFDLLRPFFHNQMFYIQSAAIMLQFAEEVQEYHARENVLDQLQLIRDKEAEIKPYTELLINGIGQTPGLVVQLQQEYNAMLILAAVQNRSEAQQQQLAEFIVSVPFLVNLLRTRHPNFPDTAAPDADGNSYQTQVEQLKAQLDAELAILITGYNAAGEALNYSAYSQMDRTWRGALHVLNRLRGFMRTDHQKLAKNFDLSNANEAEITIFEPIVVGPCKPSEYCEVGCWETNSNILPYIDRFKIGIEWGAMDLFEIDQYKNTHFVEDMFSRKRFYPKLAILNQTTKLHVNFVEHPVAIPAAIPLIDVEMVQIARLTTAKKFTETVHFRDIDLRRQPKHIMIHCIAKKNHDEVTKISSDKSASIVSVKLRTDIQYKSLEADSVEYVNALTCRNFPGYTPPLGLTGNVFCINMNELPQAKESAEIIHLMGEIDVCQDWSVSLEYSVYISLFYGDRYWQINDTYQRGILDL